MALHKCCFQISFPSPSLSPQPHGLSQHYAPHPFLRPGRGGSQHENKSLRGTGLREDSRLSSLLLHSPRFLWSQLPTCPESEVSLCLPWASPSQQQQDRELQAPSLQAVLTTESQLNKTEGGTQAGLTPRCLGGPAGLGLSGPCPCKVGLEITAAPSHPLGLKPEGWLTQYIKGCQTEQD